MLATVAPFCPQSLNPVVFLGKLDVFGLIFSAEAPGWSCVVAVPFMGVHALHSPSPDPVVPVHFTHY